MYMLYNWKKTYFIWGILYIIVLLLSSDLPKKNYCYQVDNDVHLFVRTADRWETETNNSIVAEVQNFLRGIVGDSVIEFTYVTVWRG